MSLFLRRSLQQTDDEAISRFYYGGNGVGTRGTQYLDQLKIPYELKKYEHLEKGAVFAAGALEHPLEATIKTLVVELTPPGPILLLMPGDREVPLKDLARKLGARRAEMADPAAAERLTGYHVGGISPFGTRKKLQVYLEEGLTRFSQVAINAGQRGIMVLMSPQNVIKASGAKLVTLF